MIDCAHSWHKVSWEAEWGRVSIPPTHYYSQDHLDRCLLWCAKCGTLKSHETIISPTTLQEAK